MKDNDFPRIKIDAYSDCMSINDLFKEIDDLKYQVYNSHLLVRLRTILSEMLNYVTLLNFAYDEINDCKMDSDLKIFYNDDAITLICLNIEIENTRDIGYKSYLCDKLKDFIHYHGEYMDPVYTKYNWFKVVVDI